MASSGEVSGLFECFHDNMVAADFEKHIELGPYEVVIRQRVPG